MCWGVAKVEFTTLAWPSAKNSGRSETEARIIYSDTDSLHGLLFEGGWGNIVWTPDPTREEGSGEKPCPEVS